MTVTSTWQIEFVDASTTTDLTSNVLGFSIRQNVSLTRITGHTGNMTLNNNANLFTPGAGGTYASFGWFSKLIKITCDINDGSTTSTAEVAWMVVQDIRFNDDGQFATVELTLVDPLTYAGRDAVEEIDVTAVYSVLDEVSQTILNGGSGLSRVPFPKFGASSATVTSVNKKNNVPAGKETSPGYWGILSEFETGTAKDYINNQVLPSGPAIIYPTVATYSSNTWTLHAAYVNRLLTKESVSSTDHYRSYEFTETDTADKFPIRRLSVQMNTVNAVNQATMQSWSPVTGEGPNVSNNTTSQDTIGIRSITFDKLITWSFGGATQANKAVIGDFWTNRFSDVTFTPQQMIVSLEGINSNIDSSSRQNYADLLDIRTGLWNVAKITYTPKGAGSSQTHASVITGRTINATPAGTEISLNLLSATDNQSLTLDKTNIGILGTNRLG